MYLHLFHVQFAKNTCVAFTQTPLLIAIGSTLKRPMVINNEIKIRDIINVSLTLDHRYTDGAKASKVYQKFVKYLHDPELCNAFDANKEPLTEVH